MVEGSLAPASVTASTNRMHCLEVVLQEWMFPLLVATKRSLVIGSRVRTRVRLSEERSADWRFLRWDVVLRLVGLVELD